MYNDIEISLNDYYNGETVRICVDKRKHIYADIEKGTSNIVKLHFMKQGRWTEDEARKWVRNRKLNRVVARKLDSGEVFSNTVCLSSSIDNVYTEESAREVLGEEKYAQLMQVDMEHGSDKPFIIKFKAMNFGGGKTAIANGMRFEKGSVESMIGEFSGITSHKGHIGFMQSYVEPIGNTVHAEMSSDGDPTVYTYFYPYGEGLDFRNYAKALAAQNLIENIKVSMYGPIDDYDRIKSDDKDAGEAFIHVKSWKPKSVDVVFEEGLEGSQAVSVVNEKTYDFTGKKGGKKLDNFSDVIVFLKGQETVALSDLMSCDCVKAAIDQHVQLALDKQKVELANDEEFVKGVVAGCDKKILEEDTRVEEMVKVRMSGRKEKIDENISKIQEIAKNGDVVLTKAQAVVVKASITGEESEQEILELCKVTSKLVGLSDDVVGTLYDRKNKDSETVKNSKQDGLFGASREEISASDIDKGEDSLNLNT